mmetsp:Transcript_32857/g.69966  ORF Transcript_32857/g.69966 Transcript_32857/m.69966 type:complete len:91 (-) Transcript_32857:313-585(-)
MRHPSASARMNNADIGFRRGFDEVESAMLESRNRRQLRFGSGGRLAFGLFDGSVDGEDGSCFVRSTSWAVGKRSYYHPIPMIDLARKASY